MDRMQRVACAICPICGDAYLDIPGPPAVADAFRAEHGIVNCKRAQPGMLDGAATQAAIELLLAMPAGCPVQ